MACAERDENLFSIFLGLRTKDGVDEQLTLSARSRKFKLTDLEFYKLNADHSGTYRTLCPPSRLEKLSQAAKSGLLTV